MDFIQAGFHVFYDNLYAPVHHIIVEKKKKEMEPGHGQHHWAGKPWYAHRHRGYMGQKNNT